MRDKLPKKIKKIECGVINLDNADGPGTHWTAYKKHNQQVIYFDSYGNLQPPLEAIRYFNSNGPSQILFNHHVYQKSSKSVHCGHLCLLFLLN